MPIKALTVKHPSNTKLVMMIFKKTSEYRSAFYLFHPYSKTQQNINTIRSGMMSIWFIIFPLGPSIGISQAICIWWMKKITKVLNELIFNFQMTFSCCQKGQIKTWIFFFIFFFHSFIHQPTKQQIFIESLWYGRHYVLHKWCTVNGSIHILYGYTHKQCLFLMKK